MPNYFSSIVNLLNYEGTHNIYKCEFSSFILTFSFPYFSINRLFYKKYLLLFNSCSENTTKVNRVLHFRH